ncbi:MAG: DUF4982 domain-containing protein [Rikenellaceae bacterium]|nr:DUF4982 domain-containing protein [Rikenellaceae bacterium]
MAGVLLAAWLICCPAARPQRQRIDFNDHWRFTLLGDSTAYRQDTPDSHWRTLNLPHDWSIESDFSVDFPATPGGGALPGGMGWYRKTFRIEAEDRNRKVYIHFDGIYWQSRVWINGHFLGERPNGYISFEYDLTPYLNFDGENIIAVQVDNTEQPNSRWYSGSGIYRNVWLVKTAPVHVSNWGTFVRTPEVSHERARILVNTLIRNTLNSDQSVELTTTLLDAQGRVVARIGKGVTVAPQIDINGIEQQLTVENPVLWSLENPYLYTLRTEIWQNGTRIDQYDTPTGIRYFHFDAEKGFFLNGQHTKILGVCMHHDLGCLGTAVNTRALERQLEILQAMGCNSIRTSHNPPAPELLDLCDRMGFIVQDEAFDMWRKKKSPHDYAQYFPEWFELDLAQLILRDRNHPSVMMWSIGNEILEQWTDIKTDTLDLQQANLMFNFAHTLDRNEFQTDELHINSLLTIRLADIVRQLDPTRPVTSGNNETRPTNHLFRSGAMDLIGFNYHEKDWPEFHGKFPGQRLIIAESTSGLMSRGYYEMPSDSIRVRPERWDKPFDLPVRQNSSYDSVHVPWGSTHETSWRLVKKYDHIAGLYVWTGFDYLGEPTPFWWPARSSYFGIVDLAGFPKDIYYMYRSEWTDQPVLHVFPHWNWTPGEMVDVWAYYNQADEVELYLNGRSLGKKFKHQDEFHVSWRVPFEPGTLRAVSRKNGAEILSREIKTAGTPASIRLSADRSTIKADGKDLSFVTVEVLDAEGNAVPTADHFFRFTVTGEGVIAGTDNGDPTDHRSLSKPERKLFNGKALVVLRSGRVEGNLRLSAVTEGLPEAVIDITVQ